ncbi:MAG: protein kinase [Vicinamibacterales bacterium]
MVGQTVSHYRVNRRLGGGGMGEVYEALDTSLGRRVAIKFLSTARAKSHESVLRFEREARAASALNHPHICTIHDFGLSHEQPFIVMELLDGSTLRDRLKSAPFHAPFIVDWGCQIADALEAAHTARIIHRDITPANIFITAAGHVKILDFGLAKLTPGKDVYASIEQGEAEETHEQLLTSPGAALGTTPYMSPEQIRADPLDQRTDLFSFGCVLYEMATGRRAFEGRSSALIFDAVLRETPAAPRDVNPAVPEDLDRLIRKALEKDPDLRYQTAREIKADLLRLDRDSDAAAVDRPVSRSRLSREPGQPTPGTSGPAIRARRIVKWAVALGIAVAAAAGYLWIRHAREEPAWTSPRQITTEAAPHMDPALSPDGTTVAFTSTEGGRSFVWLADARTGASVRLTRDSRDERSPAWFPDGSAVVFVAEHDERAALWKAPRMPGSQATLVIDDADEPAVSPDGTRLAFVRPNAQGEPRIAVASLPAATDVQFVTGEGPEFGLFEHREPAWSPDGRRIGYRAQRDLFIVTLTAKGTGTPARLTRDDARDGDPAWSRDGRFVYFTSTRENTLALWWVRAAGGVPKRLTRGAGPERHPTVSADGGTLVYSAALDNPDLVLRDFRTGTESAFGSSRDDRSPVFLPDGSGVVFVSDRMDGYRLWAQPLSAGAPSGEAWKVTDQPGTVSHPAVSPDGRWVAYFRVIGGQRDIWIAPAVGGPAQQFTTDPAAEVHPAWSPDGRRLAFVSDRTGTNQVWVSGVQNGRATGTPMVITTQKHSCFAPVWSPDGTAIAYVGGVVNSDVYLVPSGGLGPARQVTSGATASRARWNRATGRLLVLGGWGKAEALVLKDVDPADGTAREVVPSPVFGRDLTLYDFDISADGRWLVFSREEVRGNLWSLKAGPSRW